MENYPEKKNHPQKFGGSLWKKEISPKFAWTLIGCASLILLVISAYAFSTSWEVQNITFSAASARDNISSIERDTDVVNIEDFDTELTDIKSELQP